MCKDQKKRFPWTGQIDSQQILHHYKMGSFALLVHPSLSEDDHGKIIVLDDETMTCAWIRVKCELTCAPK